MKKKFLFTFFCFFISCIQSFASPLYTISDMGLDDGREPSYASSINNSGQVVGRFGLGSSCYVFLWEEETGVIALFPAKGVNTCSLKINNLGQVAGNSSDTPMNKYNPGLREFGFIWDIDVGFQYLGCKIRDINDYGVVVGEYGHNRVPAWVEGKLEGKIKKLSQYTTSINNLGQIVGHVFGSVADPKHKTIGKCDRFDIAFLIDGGEIKEIFPENRTFRTPSPVAINDQGQILCRDGNCIISPDGTRVHLNGFNYGYPMSMNNKGDVVGVYSDSNIGVRKACLWSDGKFYILEDLIEDLDEWTRIEHAYDINDNGQIVGFGNKNGVTKAFLLNPK